MSELRQIFNMGPGVYLFGKDFGNFGCDLRLGEHAGHILKPGNPIPVLGNRIQTSPPVMAHCLLGLGQQRR